MNCKIGGLDLYFQISEGICSENEELEKDRDVLKKGLEEGILQKEYSEHILENNEINCENPEEETLSEEEEHEDVM